MKTIFFFLFAHLSRFVFKLRYKLEIRGLEQLDKLDRKKGILFLPNHPAHMDPWIIFSHLWHRFRMRPLVIEYIYRKQLLRPFHRMVRSLAVPNFDTSVNPMKVRRAQNAMKEIAEGLKSGEHFILWPAGRLKPQAKEIVGGASAAHALVQECPDADVVLIRTTGLWGSMFSRSLLGRSPDLSQMLLKGLFIILKNGIFFTPRRKVVIEIEVNPPELPLKGDRLEFNRFLENWYNHYPDEEGNRKKIEPLKLVSYSFWQKILPDPFQNWKKKEKSEGEISEEVREKVYGEIRRILEKPKADIQPNQNLALDLGMDSLNVAELIVFLTRHFDTGEVHPEDVETVQGTLEVAQGLSSHEHTAASSFTWPEEKKRPFFSIPEGKSIPEAFLHCCRIRKDASACADDLSGPVSYNKLKKSVLVLAQYFRKFPEEKVAVLLPASVAAYATILALQFAGKIPVMLNWTLGPRYLEEMMRLSGAEKMITSWRFLDRAPTLDLGPLESQTELLEDIRASLSLSMKLRGLFLTKRSPAAVLRAMDLDRLDENRPAVILFTSGTEASPKGVPLSHKNILSNQRAACQCLELHPDETFYGILPPFHSFGFNVAGLFPILVGLKVAFYPDPTDSFALAEGIERWKVTLFCSAPSFMKGLFHAAKEAQLKTVRLFVTGAEKASPDMFEKVAQLGSQLIEGYGITECSPVLSATRTHLPPVGVGQPLPDIEVCTIHPETQELLPGGKEGELCFRGPNVFNGYLGNPRSPFIELGGKRWYRSGDIGYLDEGGNLILSGRLKRFTKVGGEMISLGAVEEVLWNRLKTIGKIKQGIPSMAVIADERNPDKSQLILVSTVPMDRDEANEILHQSGFSRLVKISSAALVPEIPMMGTGKTDYRKLQTQVQQQEHASQTV